MPKQRRTAQGDSIESFLTRRAEEEVENYLDNLSYDYDPERFQYDIEDLLEDAGIQAALREYGLTPQLFRGNPDPFYEFVKENWQHYYDEGEIDWRKLDEFAADWQSEFLSTVTSFLEEQGIDEDAIEAVEMALDDDSIMLGAFLCGEGWSCDWFNEVADPIKEHTGIEVETHDIGLEGFDDAGTNLYMEVSWPAQKDVLKKLLEMYLTEDWDDEPGIAGTDLDRFKDPRQRELPLSASTKRRLAAKRRSASDDEYQLPGQYYAEEFAQDRAELEQLLEEGQIGYEEYRARMDALDEEERSYEGWHGDHHYGSASSTHRKRRTADLVNMERYYDEETGAPVVYQGEEIFSGRPHATEDMVKGFIASLLLDPDYTDDELELGRMASARFQIQGAENPNHPIWDWVDEVVDDMAKRRHSSAKNIVGHYGKLLKVAADETALEKYQPQSPAVYDVEDVEAELNPDSWEIDEHYWGLKAVDGEIVRVRLGNWSDAGWHWSNDGDGLLLFLWRLARTGDGDILEEFRDAFPNPEFRRALERTFNRIVSEGDLSKDSPLNSLAYGVTGDNSGWHFGGNADMLDSPIEMVIENIFDEYEEQTYFREKLDEAFKELRKFGIRLTVADIDMGELREFFEYEFDWDENCQLDEDQILKDVSEDFEAFDIDLSSPWSLMETARDYDDMHFYEWINEHLYEVADACVYSNLERLMPQIVEWAVKNYGEEVGKELPPGEDVDYFSNDPRQQELPLKEGMARFASAATAWMVKAARIPKEELRGFEFAMPVEFIFPDTGQKGFGRIMDFTRSPDGIIISVAPHLYREDQEWFRRDPHDFVDVHIDNVFPTDKPFPKFINQQQWPPKKEATGYGSEMSAPMFRTTGQDELSSFIADDMLHDTEMKELVEVALDMSARKSRDKWQVTWDELASYLHDIYLKYGEAPDLSDGADWHAIAQDIYQELVGKAAEQYVASARPRLAAVEENIADEIVTDKGMQGAAVEVISRLPEGNKVAWDELGQALRDVYTTGRPEEKSQFWAGRADWDWIAQHVYRSLTAEKQEKAASTRRTTARRGEDLGRPRMHREESFGEDQFKRFTRSKSTKKRRRQMTRQEGGYKSKKKLKEFLHENGDPHVGWGDETYGKKSMIYLDWPDMAARKEWERKLEDAGFKVRKRYWPGHPTSEIQVSYFKGWHWDE